MCLVSNLQYIDNHDDNLWKYLWNASLGSWLPYVILFLCFPFKGRFKQEMFSHRPLVADMEQEPEDKKSTK